MKDKLYILLLIINIFAFYSCDLLRTSLFEVTSWTPGGGYHPEPEKIVVSLDFSLDPDMASVERYFSLTGNGNPVRGSFLWNGRKMTFIPFTPLEKNTDYAVNLSADAHDTAGLSMDEAFNSGFTTRPDNTRPVLLSWYPEMYAEVSDPREEVRLSFSVPVPLNSLYDYVSFTPSMAGLWRLEDNGKLAIFTPAEPWIQHSRYEIRFSASLTDNNGMNIGNDFLSIFTAGTDHETPRLLYAQRITKDGGFVLLNPDKGYIGAAESPVENHEWEKDDRLLLVFSKPVDGLSVKNYVSAENAPGIVMETPPVFNTEFIFRFDSIPAYESRFTFRIKPGVKDSAGNESKDEYIYRIFANGKYSRPPMLAGLRIPMAPNSEEDLEFFFTGADLTHEKIEITDENYPSNQSIRTWIELYFITAEGASIDPFSIMGLFRVETSNNVISFSPSQVKDSGFSVFDPQPGWENFERLEIAGNLTNSVNFGVIVFQIGAGLRDSLGNRNENTQKISVVK